MKVWVLDLELHRSDIDMIITGGETPHVRISEYSQVWVKPTTHLSWNASPH